MDHMISQARHWAEFAGHERALLGRHLNGSASAAVAADRDMSDDATLLPLLPIGLLTLFMVSVIISPL